MKNKALILLSACLSIILVATLASATLCLGSSGYYYDCNSYYSSGSTIRVGGNYNTQVYASRTGGYYQGNYGPTSVYVSWNRPSTYLRYYNPYTYYSYPSYSYNYPSTYSYYSPSYSYMTYSNSFSHPTVNGFANNRYYSNSNWGW